MAKPRGYKRGITLFLLISIGTFALMYYCGEKPPAVNQKIGLLSQEDQAGELPLEILEEQLLNYTNIRYIGRLHPDGTLALPADSELRSDEVHGWLRADIEPEVLRLSAYSATNTSNALFEESYPLAVGDDLAAHLAQLGERLSQAFPPIENNFGIMESIKAINIWFLLLALVFWGLNMITDSIMLRILLRSVDEKMSMLQCYYAFLGNEFLNAVTPFQSGGQPLMVYIMHKNGVGVGKGILITFFKTAGQIYFFALSAPIVLLIWPDLISISSLSAFYIYGMLFFGYFIALTFFMLFKPRMAKRASMSIFTFLRRFKYFRKKNMGKGLRKIIKEINVFNFFTRKILKKRKMTFVWLFLFTALAWIFKFFVAVAIIWGLSGFVIDVVKAISVQTVTNFLAFFAPSPGASGVFEFSMKKVFEYVLDNTDKLLVFVFLWRFITYYLSVFLGGLVVVKVLKIKKNTLNEEGHMIDRNLGKSPQQELDS